MSGDKRLRGMNVTWQIGRNPSLLSAATVPMAAISDALGLADWGLVAAKFATDIILDHHDIGFNATFGPLSVHINRPLV